MTTSAYLPYVSSTSLPLAKCVWACSSVRVADPFPGLLGTAALRFLLLFHVHYAHQMTNAVRSVHL